MGLLASAFAAFCTLILAIIPAANLPGASSDDRPPFPAPPGYLLPWMGGEIHAATQGEETSLTHNGRAAYAFDFDLHYDIVAAARAGRVTAVRQDSDRGGCGREYAGAANYVLIDHGDGTSALYLHLAPKAVLVLPGQFVDQGQGIAVSGETGVTCSDIGEQSAPHLHFQVQRTDAKKHFAQSIPITFDDVSGDDGVPVEGTSYVSGNYGPGKPQKIKLTQRRTERPFSPRAVPSDPRLIEAEPLLVEETATPAPGATGTSTATPSRTPEPTETATETPTRTPTHTATPTATASPLPSETPAPTELPTLTPEPEPPSATPPPTDTPEPVAPTETPTPADIPAAP